LFKNARLIQESFTVFCLPGFNRNNKESNFIVLKCELGSEIHISLDPVFQQWTCVNLKKCVVFPGETAG